MTKFVKVQTNEGPKIGVLEINEIIDTDDSTVGAEPKQCGSSSAVTTVPSGQ